MFKHVPVSRALVFVFSAILGLGVVKGAKLHIQVHNGQNKSIELKVFHNLSGEFLLLADSNTDSHGVVVFDLDLRSSGFIGMEVSRRLFWLYLEPETELHIEISDSGVPTFSGDASSVNRYLFEVGEIEKRVAYPAGEDIIDLELSAYLQRINLLERSFDELHKKYKQSTVLSDELLNVLEFRNRIYIQRLNQLYAWQYMNVNDLLADSLGIGGNIIFDENILNTHMVEYTLLIDVFFETRYISILGQDLSISEKEKLKQSAPRIIANKIREDQYPKFAEELLQAKNIFYWLKYEGVGSLTDSLYNNFIKAYPNSIFRSILQEQYEEWSHLSPGSMAPDIVGIMLDGSVVSIKDFKGKVLFIDVWATWCKPCIDQIPYSNDLQLKFNNDEIIFINLSVDTNKEKWKRKVKDDIKWSGLHLIEKSDQKLLVTNTYRVKAIPRYIIIDKAGNIVNVNSLSPVSGDALVKELKILLH